MKDEEIEALKPGLEFDRIVAEKVMQWVVERRYPDIFICHTGNETVPNRVIGDGHLNGFEPSREISAAFEVLTEIQHKGITLIHDTEKWICETCREDGEIVRATSIEAPEAICKAALFAVFESSVPTE